MTFRNVTHMWVRYEHRDSLITKSSTSTFFLFCQRRWKKGTKRHEFGPLDSKPPHKLLGLCRHGITTSQNLGNPRKALSLLGRGHVSQSHKRNVNRSCSFSLCHRQRGHFTTNLVVISSNTLVERKAGAEERIIQCQPLPSLHHTRVSFAPSTPCR